MTYLNHQTEHVDNYHELQRQADIQHVQATTDRINIPDTWNNIDDFAQWYRAAGFPILPPADTKVYVTDMSYSTIVFRKGPFQVEMYLMAPDQQALPHSHNHESKFVFLAGDIIATDSNSREFKLGSYGRPRDHDRPDPDCGLIAKAIRVDHTHAIRTLSRGGVFFNIEMWPNPTIP
jgi:mannose-6-phosphate isomerase-like protein (cupin superfamily)